MRSTPSTSSVAGGLRHRRILCAVAGLTLVCASQGDATAEEIVLEGPERDDWTPVYDGTGARTFEDGTEEHPYVFVADRFRAPIFDKVQNGRRVIGRFWRGAMTVARRARTWRRCNDRRGRWYALPNGGYLCNTYGFSRANGPSFDTRRPDVEGPLPFRYARVIDKGALRLKRLPRDADELHTLESRKWGRDRPDVVVEPMLGDFFLSLDRRENKLDRTWFRTVRGEYVKAEALKVREGSPMLGEQLGDDVELPLAFVHHEDPQPVYCNAPDGLEACGTAEHHARFEIDRQVEIDGARYVVTPRNRLVATDSVRIASEVRRPSKVPDYAKWVHFDLEQQAFVAYEGDDPVYASLFSSGKPGRDTPDGLYQIQRKYLTKTMRGSDAVEGIYHVEDVPWTMYYRGPYAVHGAYWHDVFGNTRSHGCTNLAPADARWMYYWSRPEMPEGWHTRLNIVNGTYFYFTD